jgi:hypothetical protein
MLNFSEDTGCSQFVRPQFIRLIMLVFAAMLPAACAAVAPPSNPFVGAWANPEKRQIAFRDDTIVITPANATPTALGAASCDGKFRFSYGQKSRDALLTLTPLQPDLQRRIAAQLQRPDYPVAELACGDGGTIYVLLAERDVLAIYHDRDIAGIERLTR